MLLTISIITLTFCQGKAYVTFHIFHFQFQLLFLLYCKNVLLNRECEFTQMRFKDVRFRISNLMAQKRNSLSIRELEAVMSFTSQALDDISSRFIAE